jgi:hypothetical protein
MEQHKDFADRINDLEIALTPVRPEGVEPGVPWQVPVGVILLNQPAPDPDTLYADTVYQSSDEPLPCPECANTQGMYVVGAWDESASVRCGSCGHVWKPFTQERYRAWGVRLTNMAIAAAVREHGIPTS